MEATKEAAVDRRRYRDQRPDLPLLLQPNRLRGPKHHRRGHTQQTPTREDQTRRGADAGPGWGSSHPETVSSQTDWVLDPEGGTVAVPRPEPNAVAIDPKQYAGKLIATDRDLAEDMNYLGEFVKAPGFDGTYSYPYSLLTLDRLQGIHDEGVISTGWLVDLLVGAAFPSPSGGIGLLEGRTVAQVRLNYAAGKAFESEMATAYRAAGFEVRQGVYYRTAIGRRFVDLEVRWKGVPVRLIELKVGASPYTVFQRMKDLLIYNETGLWTDLVRAADLP